ncbi:MAG: PfkB family carbohydrate kinase [Defluviitaleaceae bacterium]|nr:PfkB family carbohydrate kinase [Defluviitaleaceae bacterium]
MKNAVTVIGGANMDIVGFPNDVLKMGDSNPGKVKTSVGGVGRNIADNLARLGVDTKLITAVGDDTFGHTILKEARTAGLDMSESLVCAGGATSVYLSLLDDRGEMVAALSHMDILEEITPGFLRGKSDCIKSSRLIIVDANLSAETLGYLTEAYSDIPFILDTVSAAKAVKVKDIIGRFHTIKPNRAEAEVLTGMSVQSPDDAKLAAEYLLNKGVKRIYLSLSEEGLFYSDGQTSGRLPHERIKPINTTGAGDAFVAAAAYGYVNNTDIRVTAELARNAAIMTMLHPDTVNPNISLEKIKNL